MRTNILVNNGKAFTENKKDVLAPAIKRLIQEYQKNLQKKEKGEDVAIHVDEIASKVAHLYERIRKIVDWKEENVLRRNAIERILKRYLISEISSFSFIFKGNISEIAEILVLELIRGGHLPNNEVPRASIAEVSKILTKYVYLLKNTSFAKSSASFVLKKKVNFFNWILEIAACDIEEVLSPPFKETILIEAMTVLMNERIRLVPPELLNGEEKMTQTYIAVHRTLFDLDDALIAYHLLKRKYPFWNSFSDSLLKETTENIFSIWKNIKEDLHHPLAKEFFNLCERTDTVFTILGDILDYFQKEPEQIEGALDNKQNYQKLIAKFYNLRLTSLKSRLFKLAIFSSLSVFVSNWFTFFIVEVPLANLFYEGFKLSAAIFDFFIPSVAMFVLVAIIKPPSPTNLTRVIELSFSFTYPDEEKEIYEIKERKKRKPLTNFWIILLYLITCLASFGAVAYAFRLVAIPFTSVVLDTIGIAVNVFAALVIRNKAKEITVEEKGSFWEFLLDIMSLPVAETGSWIASRWKEYNVVSIFFNVIVEIPFVTFIEFLENWRQFLRDRKASIH